MIHSREEEAASKEAEILFTRRAAESWFASPFCNRFELRFLSDGKAVLTFGSIGVVALNEAEFMPVAQPIATVQVDPTLLRNLADLIEQFVPKTSEG